MSQPSQPPSYPPFDPPPTPPRPAGPSPFPTQPPTQQKPLWGRRWFMLAVVVVLFLPAVVVLAPAEIAAWHLAAAQEDRAAGKNHQAYDRLADAMRWSPQQPGLLLQRAAWRLEDGQADAALTDANQAAEVRPKDENVLMLRAQILQQLGRHAEAIADWKALDRLSLTRGSPDRAKALNGLAYARAVGKLELKDALKNVEESLTHAKGDPFILDTRGYIYYLQGEHGKALADLDQAVKGVEAVGSGTIRQPPSDIDLSGITTPEQGIAVVRYHRALVLQALGREDDAKKDLDRARQLIGREPDETLF